jgi:Tfp pilus assembly protein PilX
MTMMFRDRPRPASLGGDEGFALATVLLVMALVTTLVMITAGVVIASLRSSGDHDKFEGAVGAAEAGVDTTLSKLQADQKYYAGPAINQTFATPDAERQWAYTTLMAQVTAGVPYTNTGTGQFIAIRPPDRNVIYSLGCTPTCGTNISAQRLLKVEYLFAPYKPGNAILTAGNLSFSSSVTVDVTAGVTSGAANVHTNGDAVGSGCSQTVNGVVSSSGSYSVCGTVGMTGSGGGQPTQSVPTVTPRFLYDEFASTYSTNWYDLCPNGTVRAPNTVTGSDPCTGALLADESAGGTYRGWSFVAGSGTTPPTWNMFDTTWGDGIYYVYQGNANIARNIVANAISVIAESAPTGGTSATCGKLGGDISAQGVTINSAALPGVIFVAQGQLSVTSNFSAGVGVFAAGDQVHIETSSNGITGTVIANDTCTASGNVNEVKNAVIKYDKNVEIPLVDIVRTTQWLELQPNAK